MNLKEIEPLAKCFSSTTKLRIINLLMNQCYLTISDVRDIIGISKELAFNNMNSMVRTDIVSSMKVGKYNIYHSIMTTPTLKKYFELFQIEDDILDNDLAVYKSRYKDGVLHINKAIKFYNNSIEQFEIKKKKFERLQESIAFKEVELKIPIKKKEYIEFAKKVSPHESIEIQELKARIKRLESEKGLKSTTDK